MENVQNLPIKEHKELADAMNDGMTTAWDKFSNSKASSVVYVDTDQWNKVVIKTQDEDQENPKVSVLRSAKASAINRKMMQKQVEQNLKEQMFPDCLVDDHYVLT